MKKSSFDFAFNLLKSLDNSDDKNLRLRVIRELVANLMSSLININYLLFKTYYKLFHKIFQLYGFGMTLISGKTHKSSEELLEFEIKARISL